MRIHTARLRPKSSVRLFQRVRFIHRQLVGRLWACWTDVLECLPENTDLLLASLNPLGLPKNCQNTEEKLVNGLMLRIVKHIIQYNTMRHLQQKPKNHIENQQNSLRQARFVHVLKEVFYAYKSCIYLTKHSKNCSTVKYYKLKSAVMHYNIFWKIMYSREGINYSVFSVMIWSFRNHSDMQIWFSRKIYY